MKLRAYWVLAGLAASPVHGALPVLLEAESFANPGGWVIDAQFMDQMGSPYLLAHGLGRPVADATTTADLPAGTWRVWVRTLDWVARWQAPGTPGRFQVRVDEQPLAVEFGTEGADWHWQDGGCIARPGGKTTIALHDLTGFEGRCDAILFAAPDDPAPPSRDPKMSVFRRRALGEPEAPVSAGRFDLVVVGGGIAGTCAAVTAARLGLEVALVQDRPVLGGNNSSEVRVWLQGARNKDPWPRVGDVVAELEQARRAHYGASNSADLYEDERKLAVASAETNLTLFLEHRANAVEMAGARIRAVIAQPVRGGPRIRIEARWVGDCTGDGEIGFLAGADLDVTPAGRMGACNLWNVRDTGAAAPFSRCPWALNLADKPFPGRHPTRPDVLKLGGWYWESGFDRDPIADMEAVRDWNFRAMYGAWDAMKNVDGVLTTWALNWSAFVMGKRESRRLTGDVVLTLSNLVDGVDFPDGCVPTGWKVDLHLPDRRYERGFEGDAFISAASFGAYRMPYWIPYRCLYSRTVPNLFMAGRCISVTHEALGAVRVMRTGGCMGEVVGMAARVCRDRDTDPRGVYAKHLGDLQALMRRGVGRENADRAAYVNQGEPLPAPVPARRNPPAWLAAAGSNVASFADVTVSGSRDERTAPPALLTDGRANLSDNAGRWLSETGVPHWVEFAWKTPQNVAALRVVSGWNDGHGHVLAPVEAMRLQTGDGKEWHDVPAAAVADNRETDWAIWFAPVRTKQVRLLVTAAKDGMSRIWEIEIRSP